MPPPAFRTHRRRRLVSPRRPPPPPIPRVPFVRRARCRVKRLTRPDPSILPLLRTGAHIPGPVVKVKVPREFRTGTVRAAELPLPAGVRARRDGDESASSSSPEPAENDPRRANAIGDATARTASAAAAGTDHLDAPKHPRYDRDDAGVFPPRPLCNWTESNHARARCPRGAWTTRRAASASILPRAPRSGGCRAVRTRRCTSSARARPSCPCGRRRARRWSSSTTRNSNSNRRNRACRGAARGTTRRRPASARGPDTSRSTANSRGRRAGC